MRIQQKYQPKKKTSTIILKKLLVTQNTMVERLDFFMKALVRIFLSRAKQTATNMMIREI